LRSLTREEWNAPTVAGAWTVKDVVAHLLDTCLRRLSLHRDAHEPPPLTSFNDVNQSGVAFAKRLSPAMLIDLHERYGAQLSEFMQSLDPSGPAKWPVSWAGEEQSQNWFDVARELTERWHHQQQIRDALGRGPLFAPYLGPVLDAFMRALPYAYREVADGPIVVRITHEGEGVWSLVDGQLHVGEASDAACTVTLRGDKAWRIFTKQKIDAEARIEGDAALAEPLLRMLAIVV
jgi:uncharacterized protein (TIGR03083 family)